MRSSFKFFHVRFSFVESSNITIAPSTGSAQPQIGCCVPSDVERLGKLWSMEQDCFILGDIITIYYFPKEEADCKFVSEAYKPVKVPFTKGIGQRFRQPSGTGVDLGFFELDDLCKPSPGEDVFRL
ncbi:hypothetical protein OSB04_011520 [Centaurea solstitialis]|uniref:RING-type E3 ubiquitin transferase n=1 Tax=Centaurea solstitialis TaxID=347529 RepID=A0AA38TMQ5_9ASTR|nr:hypothetical protein OSB04_011520 [Centaurea solstitialis]